MLSLAVRGPKHVCCGLFTGLIACCLVTGAGIGQDDQRSPSVVAWVDERPIDELELRRALYLRSTRQSFPAAGSPLWRQLRQVVVDRHLVMHRLKAAGQLASDAAVAQEVERVLGRFTRTGESVDEYLAGRMLNRDTWREEISWRLSWKAYLAKYQTDENLEKYFQLHRRDFDGTELHVSHILFPVGRKMTSPGHDVAPSLGKGSPDDEPALAEVDRDRNRVAQARQQAATVRTQLVEGKLTFAEAARQFSQSPTAEEGGDIGWISRHGPMPAAFTQAAFVLDEQGISEPVESSVGVHLIKCLEIEPGTRTLAEVRAEVATAVGRHLFRWLADQERKCVDVRLSDAGPGQ